MLYEQNNKHGLDEYILSNVKCLYGKHRCDALYIKPGAMLIYEAQSVMY